MIFRIVNAAAVAVLLAGGFTATPLSAQWLKYPTPGVPRTADGKPDLTAPTPRTADGTPDFSGLWITGNALPCDGDEFFSFGTSLRGGLPYKPEVGRPAYGHVEIEVTVDDPKNYTRPWTVMLKQAIVVDTELVDEICLENEKSWERMQATPQR